MGTNSSSLSDFSNESLKRFDQHFKFVKDLDDVRFGRIAIYAENNTQEYVMLVDRMLSGEDEFAAFQKELKESSKLNHPNLMVIWGHHKETNKNVCGHTNKMTIYSEWHQHDLETELERRQGDQDKLEEKFSEPELWYLADCLISVGAYLQEQGISHGDIRPMNIILTADGTAKISDHAILNALHTNYYKTLTSNVETFLAPELIKELAKKKKNPQYNYFKADVYSFGMSMLAAANLSSGTECYDYFNKQIRENVVNDQIAKLELQYSPNLIELIKKMLANDPAQRPDFEELRADLGYIKNQPVQFQPQPQFVPQQQQQYAQQYLPMTSSQAQGPVSGSQPLLFTSAGPQVFGGAPLYSSQGQFQQIPQFYDQQGQLNNGLAYQNIQGGQMQMQMQMPVGQAMEADKRESQLSGFNKVN